MIAERLGERTSTVAAMLHGIVDIAAADDRIVTGVSMDSRAVTQGDLFLACAGERSHGAQWAAGAARSGAAAVAWEPAPGVAPPRLPAGTPAIEVPGLRAHAGVIAARFFDEPATALALIGVTGTNGKTSVTHFIAQALDAAGRPCGLIGTLGFGMAGRLERGTHTTPDAVAVQRALAGLRDAGARAAAMEVSSHALEQARVAGCRFRVAVFTNLTRDHLDYHGDFAAYARAKRRLFETPGLGAAVVFTDDAFGRELLDLLPADLPVTAVGSAGHAAAPRTRAERFVETTHLDLHAGGMSVALDTYAGGIEFESRLLGAFNADNLALAAAVLLELGIPASRVGALLAETVTVPGRMEHFGGTDGRPTVIVDYAHTPDALEKVLRAARAHARGKLWCIFGCGGERDRGKRPQMAAVAAAWADRVVVTDDNPRLEDPDAIVAEVAAGFPAAARWEVERDRGQAIAGAVGAAHADDVIVIAGKGHEDYQLVGTQVHPFSDRSTVAGLLAREWT